MLTTRPETLDPLIFVISLTSDKYNELFKIIDSCCIKTSLSVQLSRVNAYVTLIPDALFDEKTEVILVRRPCFVSKKSCIASRKESLMTISNGTLCSSCDKVTLILFISWIAFFLNICCNIINVLKGILIVTSIEKNGVVVSF